MITSIIKHIPREAFKVDFFLQPLTAIHLHSADLQVDMGGHGNVEYVNIFFIVAIVILVVACINFMNLATARSARRAKEVGLRKVVGAVRGQLAGQFLGETILIALLALVVEQKKMGRTASAVQRVTERSEGYDRGGPCEAGPTMISPRPRRAMSVAGRFYILQ